MKAKSIQTEALISQIQKDFDAVLLFGNDEGEINHTFSIIKNKLGLNNNTMNTVILNKEDLKKTPYLATDEANTSSLISDRRFLFILDDSAFSNDALLHYLNNKQTNALLIIKAGNLSKTNALRMEMEQNPKTLALACYPPSEQDIQRIVGAYLRENKKSITPTLLIQLVKKVSFNQQLVTKELDKLILYMGDQTTVTQQIIDDCLTDSFQANLDTFCIDFADGNVDGVQRTLSAIIDQDDMYLAILKQLRNYLEKLLKIISDHSAPVAVVVKKNLTPAQFRLENPLIRQARSWTPEMIFKVLDELSTTEKNTRQTGFDSALMFNQAILQLALSVKRSIGLR